MRTEINSPRILQAQLKTAQANARPKISTAKVSNKLNQKQ
jgi:hypothetical protein